MVSPGFPFDPISTPYSSKRTAKNPPLISSKRTLGSLEVSLGQKGKSVRPVMTQQKDPNHARFLDETLWREKLSHRQPHRIIDALSKFELHRCLLRCVRVWECWARIGDARARPRRSGRFHFAHFSTNCRVRFDGSRIAVKIY